MANEVLCRVLRFLIHLSRILKGEVESRCLSASTPACWKEPYRLAGGYLNPNGALAKDRERIDPGAGHKRTQPD
jgi:hypothetical protein